MSDLYNVSLDELLKGDSEMIKHLEESTNIVSSNKKLLIAFGINIIFFILFIFFNGVISSNNYLIIGASSIGILSISALFYQIIKKF